MRNTLAIWLVTIIAGCTPCVEAPKPSESSPSLHTADSGRSLDTAAPIDSADSGLSIDNCGNGVLDEGEVCDDGNQADDDYCSADCSRSAQIMVAGQVYVLTVDGRVETGGTVNRVIDDGLTKVEMTPLDLELTTLGRGCGVTPTGGIWLGGSSAWPEGWGEVPTQVAGCGLGGVASVHGCVLFDDQTVGCFSDLTTPVDAQLPPVVEIRVPQFDREQVCGFTPDSHVECWAADGNQPSLDGEFLEFDHNGNHLCGLDAAGELSCTGGYSLAPSLAPFSELTVGVWHLCALTNARRVVCNGEGIADTPPKGTFAALASDIRITCGLSTSGEVWCWDNGVPPS